MEIVAVQDANILIDCAQIGILGMVMELPYEFCTSDLIVAELTDLRSLEAVHHCIKSNTLHVRSFTADDLMELEQMTIDHTSLSLEDCSAWKLARDEAAMLLTGDGALRKKVSATGIEVHGSLWVLEELVEHKIIDPITACTKLQELQLLNLRLPESAIQKLKERWCGG